MFRIYNSDILVSADCIDFEFWQIDYQHARENLSETEVQLGDELVVFTDGSGDEVFMTKRFSRFVMKQKQALAEYLKVDVEELAQVYDKVMTIDEDMEAGTLGFHGSGFGLVAAATVEIMWMHGCTAQWLANIQSLNRKNKLGYRYRPDFDVLFEKYCKARIRLCYQEAVAQCGEFTPMMLSRECGFDNMEALAESMGYMYMCDLVHQMYIQMQKQYYENFSWETFRNRDMRERYDGIIDDLKASLIQKDNQLQNLQSLYGALKSQLEKKNDLALLNELQEKEKLLHICDEKDAEIARLKALIASQNQLIEQLQALPADTAGSSDKGGGAEDADSSIYQKRYLFVGDLTILGLEELRQRFPSSLFMNANTMNLSQVQVDAVVYLVQALGHSIYYKCKNAQELKGAKAIHFNGRRNVEALLDTIRREMQE